MKNESVSELLESGEIQMTEDVEFMVEKILEMFERGMESDTGSQFIGFGVQLLVAWRDSLSTNNEQMDLSDEVIGAIMGKS